MTRTKMSDDELPATRGDVRDLGYELRSEMGVIRADVAGLKTDVAGLKTDVADLKTEMVELHRAVISEIRASDERHRDQFGLLLDRVNADRDHAAAALDEHRRDTKLHKRR